MSNFYRICQVLTTALLILFVIRNLDMFIVPTLILFFILEGLLKLNELIKIQKDIQRSTKSILFKTLDINDNIKGGK